MNCSCPQTRLIRELKQPLRRAHKRIIRAREQSMFTFNSCQQAGLQTIRIRDDATAVTVREQASAKAIGYTSRTELNLSQAERELFDFLNRDGKLLEQERIPLNYAAQHLQARLV